MIQLVTLEALLTIMSRMLSFPLRKVTAFNQSVLLPPPSSLDAAGSYRERDPRMVVVSVWLLRFHDRAVAFLYPSAGTLNNSPRLGNPALDESPHDFTAICLTRQQKHIALQAAE